MGTLQKDANLKKAFERTFLLIRTLSEHFEFVLSPTWGYPTMNPALIGMLLSFFSKISTVGKIYTPIFSFFRKKSCLYRVFRAETTTK